jgi:hypothetical protein
MIFIGLCNKVFQFMSGQYELLTFIYDLPLIIFTYFGLIAIWCRAKGKTCLTNGFWKVYFFSIVMSIFILPFFQSGILSTIDEIGVLDAMIAYILISLVMLPYYWGLYSYSFSSNRVRKNA